MRPSLKMIYSLVSLFCCFLISTSCQMPSKKKGEDLSPSNVTPRTSPLGDAAEDDIIAGRRSPKKDIGNEAGAIEEGPAKEIQGTSEFKGSRWTYYYYKPSRLKNTKVPLIVVFHGEGQTGMDVAQITQLSSYARQHGFAVVYPSDAKGWKNASSEYVYHLIQTLSQQENIDTKKVYLVGGGEGGAFALQSTCELSKHVAATVSFMSSLTKKAYQACRPERPVPLLFVQGSLDDKIPWEPSKKSKYLSVIENLRFWQENNKCSAAFWLNKKEDLEKTSISNKDEDETHQYFNCKDSALKLVKLAGWDATWPGTTKSVDSRTKKNRRAPTAVLSKKDIHLQELIWDFLNKWSL